MQSLREELVTLRPEWLAPLSLPARAFAGPTIGAAKGKGSLQQLAARCGPRMGAPCGQREHERLLEL